MKNVFLIILYFLLIFEGNAQGSSSSHSDYDYSSYSSISFNQNLDNDNLESSSSKQSVVYVTSPLITISNSNLRKTGNTADEDLKDSKFYGVNAVVLVNGGEVKITGGVITNKAKGVSSICATNSGIVKISGTTISSIDAGSARGLHATYNGTIIASNIHISISGGSSATLSTDRGEGTVSCTQCKLYPTGSGSPIIYSAGTTSTITVSGTFGRAFEAQCVAVEGKNTAIVQDNSHLVCYGYGYIGDIDKCGIFIYQSMSGNAGVGTATFKCIDSTLAISSSSTIYDSAPMFVITNTSAEINLENCTLNYGSKIFLNATTNSVGWGTSGSNEGNVNLTLTNQNIEGDFVIDSGSSLTINMINSSITGKINTENVSTNIDVILDSDSSITLTGDSYISSLTNADATGANINKGSYTFADYNGNEYTGSTSSGTTSSDTTSNNTTSNDTTDNDNDFIRVNKSNFFSISFYLLLMFILIL